MTANCEKLTAVFNDIRNRDKEASIVLLAHSRKLQCVFNGVSGDDLALAADLALLMHAAPSFAEVVKMAVKAYKDGPQPTAESPVPATEAPAPTPTESDRRPIEINIEHLIGELKISGSTDEFRQVAREKIEDVLWQAAKTISAALR